MSTDDDKGWLTEETAPEPAPAPHFQPVGVIDEVDAAGIPLEQVTSSAGRPRWLVPLVALVIAALSVSLVGAWVFSNVLSGAQAEAVRAGYAYLPATSTAVAEIRLDLPAGQKEQLGSFLSRFPGFGDAATVETKLVDLLDDLVGSATQGRASYRSDVQPFFSGWVIGATTTRAMAMADTSPLMVFGVSDRAAAEAAMLKLRGPTLTWTSEDVGDIKVWSGTFARVLDAGLDLGGQAYAVTDDALLYGTTADVVKAALDTRAGTSASLLDDEAFAAALGRVPAGRLGVAWVDIAGTGMTAMMRPGLAMGGAACMALTSSIPTDALAVLYLRDGRAALDVSYSRPSGARTLPIRASALDTHVPGDVFAWAEMKIDPAMTAEAIDCLRDLPGAGDQLDELEESIGKLDDLLGWIGDAGVAARFDGSKVSGGLLIQVTDEIKASEALGQLRAALVAVGKQHGEVSVTEETYHDARLVVFEFSQPIRPLPSVTPSPSLAYALKDGLLVIGVDASFARAVLDTEAAGSLGGKASFRAAQEFSSATQNAGALFVDVPTALSLADALGDYAGQVGAEMRAYLEPLSEVSMFVIGDERTVTLRLALNTRAQP